MIAPPPSSNSSLWSICLATPSYCPSTTPPISTHTNYNEAAPTLQPRIDETNTSKGKKRLQTSQKLKTEKSSSPIKHLLLHGEENLNIVGDVFKNVSILMMVCVYK